MMDIRLINLIISTVKSEKRKGTNLNGILNLPPEFEQLNKTSKPKKIT